VLIEEAKTDLEILSIIPSQYPAGKQVVTLVTVKNNGAVSLNGERTVDVSLSIPAVGYNNTCSVSMEAGAECNVPFIWTAPAANPGIRITAEVNKSRVIPETNYSNNSMTITAVSTSSGNPSYGCNTTRRTWTERRFSHNRTVRVTVGGVSYSYSVAVYKDVSFYAEVSISAKLTPDTMKSGYGVECEVTTTVSTNYDKPGAVTGLQSVYAYSPVSGYTVAVALERVPGTSGKWRFPVNPTSVKRNRVMYVPVEWPDKSNFKIGFTGRDALSPGGALCASTDASVYIDGNMFMDDSTNPTN